MARDLTDDDDYLTGVGWMSAMVKDDSFRQAAQDVESPDLFWCGIQSVMIGTMYAMMGPEVSRAMFEVMVEAIDELDEVMPLNGTPPSGSKPH